MAFVYVVQHPHFFISGDNYHPVNAILHSPRWLIYKTKRRDEALAILTRLRSGQDISIIQMECTSIEQDVAFDAKYASKGYWTLLEKGIENNRRRTLLGIGIHALTQLTGINVLL